MAALMPAIPPPTTRIPRSRPGARGIPFVASALVACPFPFSFPNVSAMPVLGNLGGEGHLLQLPFPALRVAAGVHEDLPVLLVELGEVAPVVVARPAGLLPEEHVPQAGLGRVDPVPHLPAPEQIVEVAGGQVLAVLPEELHELQTPFQRRT